MAFDRYPFRYVDPCPPVTVALTGATGFLGLPLLRGLLARHDCVVVLARGEPATVLDRLRAFFTVTGDGPGFVADLSRRVRIVRADVTLPRLGLSATGFDALTGELHEVWHSAGDIAQDGDLSRLRQVNVDGTRHVLALAAKGARYAHVSTAFVAGRRRHGTIYDDELSDAHGFETPYERSKYEAELAVRAWAAAEPGRSAIVLRPSVLATDLPPGPHVPAHPALAAARALRALVRTEAVVRVEGRPDSFMNVMPVEDAAAVMLALADRHHRDGVDTFHIVHPQEMPVTTLLDALAETVPVRFELVSTVDDPTPLEGAVRLLSGAWAYAQHRRRYDDARVRALVDVRPSRDRIDRDYLLAGMGG
jgi:thioester reductase-like protein